MQIASLLPWDQVCSVTRVLASGINVSFGVWEFFLQQAVLFCVCRKKGDVTPFLLPAASQAARMGGVAGPSIWAPSHEQLSEWDWRKLQSSAAEDAA